MGRQILILIFISLALSIPTTFSSIPDTLTEGSSLSVENPNHVLISPNGVFSAGFHSVGENAYCFAIWFSKTLSDGTRTVVWMANRDQPVNGRLSTLSLLKTGNLILTDAAQQNVWATNTNSLTSSTKLLLLNSGNLVLQNSESKAVLWQSFDSPTDTLLPLQPLTRNTRLVSSRSQTNYSSGFYKLFYDDNNILRLLYDGLEVSSIYWPSPWVSIWAAGMNSYNSSRIGVLNSMGLFESTDNFKFNASDFGKGIWRRLTMDADGNLRMYSLDEGKKAWSVSWEALSRSCPIHGLCGPNSFCSYVPPEKSNRRCDCIPGYKMKNKSDWFYGCEPEFTSLSCNPNESIFLHLPHVELIFYGYDLMHFDNYTLENCKKQCLDFCGCFGIQYRYGSDTKTYVCYLKTLMFNGVRSPSFSGSAYVRLPKDLSFSKDKAVQKLSQLDCSNTTSIPLDRTYKC